jgi:hypothetical protein
MPIVHNTPARTVIREAANATYVVVGNNTVSNVGATGQNVVSAAITRIYWSTPDTITISRGANAVLCLRGTDHWDLKEAGISLTQDSLANVVINFGTTVASNVSLIIEISKQSGA